MAKRGPDPQPPEERFWPKVDQGQPDECWVWQASRKPTGYGRFWYEGSVIHAHRVAYTLENGDPGDLNVLHKCDNPPCVNPNHLYAGDQSQNVKDAYDRGGKDPVVLCGEENPNSVLGREEVKQIRSRHRSGGASIAALSEEFGVAQPTIHDVVTGRRWSHVE